MARELKDYIQWCADRYISLRPRTEHELQTYLMRKGHARLALQSKDSKDSQDSEDVREKSESALIELVSSIITLYKDENRINDTAYANWYVSEKNYFKPRGQMRLRYEMTQKGVDSSIIDVVFEQSPVTDMELITQMLQTRFAKIDLTNKPLREKVIRRLQQKGFSYRDIQESIKSAIEESSEKE